MSILIKDMEMPTRCYSCPCADLEYYDCNLMPGTAIAANGRLPDCPLVPIPPHGRLIDAGVLADQMAERRNYVGRLSDPLCLIEDAPTIIEAEGEE